MKAEAILTYEKQQIIVEGHYFGSDKNTNTPASLDISSIEYKGVNIQPLLLALAHGYDVINEIEEDAILQIQMEGQHGR